MILARNKQNEEFMVFINKPDQDFARFVHLPKNLNCLATDIEWLWIDIQQVNGFPKKNGTKIELWDTESFDGTKVEEHDFTVLTFPYDQDMNFDESLWGIPS